MSGADAGSACVTVAVAKWPLNHRAAFGEGRFDAFASRVEAAMAVPARAGAGVVVFPEGMANDLRSRSSDSEAGDDESNFIAMQALREQWMSLFARMARRYRCSIVIGGFPLRMANGRFRLRSDLFHADGGHSFQDRLRLTPEEKRLGCIESGDALKVFDLHGVRVAIASSYDCEFPLPVRAQCEAGARVLIVPSHAGNPAAATRVRVGCMARALENRCFVAQAVTTASLISTMANTAAEAAIIAPMDVGLPSDGMLVETGRGLQWAMAELDFAALKSSRRQAQAGNDRDWSTQYFPTVLRARLVKSRLESLAA